MDSSASAGRVASAVLDPRHWPGLALLTTASMNSARIFLNTLVGNTDEARRIDGQRADVAKRWR
jgi:hypothetical protein